MINTGYVDLHGRPILGRGDEDGMLLWVLDSSGNVLNPEGVFPPDEVIAQTIAAATDRIVKAINDFVVPADGTEEAIDRLTEQLALSLSVLKP